MRRKRAWESPLIQAISEGQDAQGGPLGTAINEFGHWLKDAFGQCKSHYEDPGEWSGTGVSP